MLSASLTSGWLQMPSPYGLTISSPFSPQGLLDLTEALPRQEQVFVHHTSSSGHFLGLHSATTCVSTFCLSTTSTRSSQWPVGSNHLQKVSDPQNSPVRWLKSHC